ncbi:MAG: hypothetical protein IT230_04960 [Flavobacteriales bacterium]|nr:hypothetical protein [Flavobacteriales bacterium]
MERIARFMEVFWLVLAVLSLGWAVYLLAVNGWEQGKVWLLFPAISTAMWGYRRYMRGKMAQWAERERQQQGPNGN